MSASMIQPGNSGICRFKTKGADGEMYYELLAWAAEVDAMIAEHRNDVPYTEWGEGYNEASVDVLTATKKRIEKLLEKSKDMGDTDEIHD